MRIVALIDGDRALVEMSSRELAHITGRESEKSFAWGFKVGADYHPSDIFHRLKKQESAKAQLAQCADSLKALSDLVRTLEPVVEIVGQDAPKENQ